MGDGRLGLALLGRRVGGIQGPKGSSAASLSLLWIPVSYRLPQLLSCCCSSWHLLTFQGACQGPLRLDLPQDKSGGLWGGGQGGHKPEELRPPLGWAWCAPSWLGAGASQRPSWGALTCKPPRGQWAPVPLTILTPTTREVPETSRGLVRSHRWFCKTI